MTIEENVMELQKLVRSQMDMINSLTNIVEGLNKRITNTDDALLTVLDIVKGINSSLQQLGETVAHIGYTRTRF